MPSCLGVAEEYNPPIRVVVLNTEHYLSMETNLIRYFPDGAAKNTCVHYGAEIGRDPITNIY